jgi:predicted nucleotidyltransferase
VPSTIELDNSLAALFAREPSDRVISVYVFGSHAEGRIHHESDIDVAVLLDRDRYPDEPGRFDARLRLIGAVGSALQSDQVDLVVLNDAPPGLSRAVITRCRRVFCADAVE